MSVAIKILLVDDEDDIRQFLEVELSRQGYEVDSFDAAKPTLRTLNGKPPDLIILDLGLPDMDGKDFIAEVRTWSGVPIIVLSARDREEEKIAALEAGADDYLTKPFGAGELMARIKVALRRRGSANQPYEPYVYRGLAVDLEKRMVQLNGEDVRLTPTEYKLLAAMAAKAGHVVTQATLINEVWGKNSQGNSHYLRIYVQHLREKLKDDPLNPIYIMTEAGVGYRLMQE